MPVATPRAPTYRRRVANKRRPVTAPDEPRPVIVRGLTAAEIAALDAIVDARNAALAAQGASTSRNAVIVAALRDLITRTRST